MTVAPQAPVKDKPGLLPPRDPDDGGSPPPAPAPAVRPTRVRCVCHGPFESPMVPPPHSRPGVCSSLDKQGRGRPHHRPCSHYSGTSRRRLLQARSYWYPVIADLHRFMIAIARVAVNHDGKGGTVPHPLVWDQGSKPEVRKLDIRVTEDLASLPGPPGFLNCDWGSSSCWSHY